jgi:hypothetical protein
VSRHPASTAMKPLSEFTRDDIRPEDLAGYDFLQAFDARIEAILAANGGVVICPRCREPAYGWPLKRGDRCNERDAVHCLRDPGVVLADIAQRAERKRARRRQR